MTKKEDCGCCTRTCCFFLFLVSIVSPALMIYFSYLYNEQSNQILSATAFVTKSNIQIVSNKYGSAYAVYDNYWFVYNSNNYTGLIPNFFIQLGRGKFFAATQRHHQVPFQRSDQKRILNRARRIRRRTDRRNCYIYNSLDPISRRFLYHLFILRRQFE